jgi:23S rRNA (guanosine2251-2'-O)-methyltransferase
MSTDTAPRIVFGIHAVRQLLERMPGQVERLLLQSDIGQARLARLAGLLEAPRFPVERRPAAELHRLAAGGKHQGVLALVRLAAPLDDQGAQKLLGQLASPPLLLLLDGVQDPRNLGACLRTANAAGADLVIAGRNRTVGLTSAASKVAAGAAEVQPLAQVANLARSMAWLADAGVLLVGTDADAPDSLYDVDLTGPVGLVLGAEGEGLRHLTRQRCDRLVRLPMAGVVDSLNVSVAAGICLYEALRQRQAGRVAAGRLLR